jgi:hypothetical protein
MKVGWGVGGGVEWKIRERVKGAWGKGGIIFIAAKRISEAANELATNQLKRLIFS